MPLLDLFWAMLWLFLFIAWIWLLITIFGDIFRRDMSGWGKAAWILVLIVLPFIGSLVYLIANGGDMAERDVRAIKSARAAQEEYIRHVAGAGSPADELTKLSALHDAGKITDEEFAAQKAKILA